MCDENYTLHWMVEKPFLYQMKENNSLLDGFVYESFINSFKFCCDAEPKLNYVQSRSQEEMMRKVGKSSIALPVTYPTRMLQSDTGVFLRVIDSAGLAFVANPPISADSSLFVQGFSTVWPLLLTALLACGFAAIVFWLSEFLVEPEKRQISRPFFAGFFDAYWFAIITATTVGYGDKVTGSRVGKVLTVIWLMFGLAILSSFTAAMTNLLDAGRTSLTTPATIRGRTKIGVLKGTMASQVVLQYGLKPIERETITELREMLELRDLEGVVINQYSIGRLTSAIPESSMVEIETVEPMSTGIVFIGRNQNNELQECIKRYLFLRVLDTGAELEDLLVHSTKIKPDAHSAATQAFSGENACAFYVTLSLALVSVIALVGAIDYSYIAYARINRKQQDRNCGNHKKPQCSSNGAQAILLVSDQSQKLESF